MIMHHAADEAAIREGMSALFAAVSSMDPDRVQRAYPPDIVSFDIEPPLQHVGAAAKGRNWTGFFAVFQRPAGYPARDLSVTAGADVAFAHSLNRVTGTLQNGNRVDYWVRWTACLRKTDGTWLI